MFATSSDPKSVDEMQDLLEESIKGTYVHHTVYILHEQLFRPTYIRTYNILHLKYTSLYPGAAKIKDKSVHISALLHKFIDLCMGFVPIT